MEWRIEQVERTGSTNEDLMEAGRRGEAAGLVRSANLQTNGHGRLGRQWISPAGRGLYCSVLLRPALSPEDAGLLSFCAANAMAEAVSSFGLPAGIKWPNDIVYEGKKICGILSVCDVAGGKLSFAVVGSGLNLLKGSYPEELADRAACLEEFGIMPSREEILRRYLAALGREVLDLESQGFEDVRQRYEKRCVLQGRAVRVSGARAAEGIVRGIGSRGELLLETAEGTALEVITGDVSVRGVMGYV